MGRIMQPIRDLALLEQIKDYLAKRDMRNWMLFVLGINTGLRISDLLPLRVRDAQQPFITLREQKTGKHRRIVVNDTLRAYVNYYLEYCDWLKPQDYMFESQIKGRPISTVQAYRIIREAGEAFGLESIGTHTMRKTFGYHFYKRTKDVATLQLILNHSTPNITMRYIGIIQDEIDDAMMGHSL
ncbi:integrase [Bacillus sp. FJAT-27264]|uniref:site-specific integrase n=1 Tax=Paenibacillus sp. (strain DSM 101736 / FJAT-27264) TaxID=1850362 RepID=UPI000807BA62|nr:site-specific integrase [Bacillus sp. FJAT-27264]OBZ15199.1 integrase [Bacillus sp. FJAT-27264]